MEAQSAETHTIAESEDIVLARQVVRQTAIKLGFNLVDQTKIVTAASELARNTLIYGGGGRMLLEVVQNGRLPGIRLTFEDQGPGIADIAQAMKDGFTSGGGMGLGLGGSKRLCDEFEIESAPGKGTRIMILRWRKV
jgi:serine/threonine-protein kinase RsbT